MLMMAKMVGLQMGGGGGPAGYPIITMTAGTGFGGAVGYYFDEFGTVSSRQILPGYDVRGIYMIDGGLFLDWETGSPSTLSALLAGQRFYVDGTPYDMTVTQASGGSVLWENSGSAPTFTNTSSYSLQIAP